MRLGKTLGTIRSILEHSTRATGRNLVVAPSAALWGWENDLTLDGIPPDLIHNLRQPTPAKRKAVWEAFQRNGGWLLTHKEAHRLKGKAGGKHLTYQKWDNVIWDESTWIKNPRAAVTKFFLYHFRDVPRRWALAGCPAPESDLDLWCQLAWLDGQAFGCKTYWEFRARFFSPPLWGYKWQPKGGTKAHIQRTLAQRALVVRRSDVGADIPAVYERREIELTPAHRRVYNKAEDEFILQWDENILDSTKWAIEKYIWLRGLAGGLHTPDALQHKRKVQALLELLQGELSQEPVVVWCAFQKEIEGVIGALNGAKISTAGSLSGRNSDEENKAALRSFQNGRRRVLVAQTKLAAMGVDLSRADTAIYYSNHPGLLDRTQSEDRLVHPKKEQDVTLLYIDLVTRDTVDVDILKALQQKGKRADNTLAEVVNQIKQRRGG